MSGACLNCALLNCLYYHYQYPCQSENINSLHIQVKDGRLQGEYLQARIYYLHLDHMATAVIVMQHTCIFTSFFISKEVCKIIHWFVSFCSYPCVPNEHGQGCTKRGNTAFIRWASCFWCPCRSYWPSIQAIERSQFLHQEGERRYSRR